MEDPVPTWSYLISRLRQDFPNLAYLHLVEPQMSGNLETNVALKNHESLEFARKLWKPRPVLLCGGYNAETARKRALEGQENGEDLLIVFGRYYISNPDLPARIKRGIPLSPYNRATFYIPGSPEGYIDYPCSPALRNNKIECFP